MKAVNPRQAQFRQKAGFSIALSTRFAAFGTLIAGIFSLWAAEIQPWRASVERRYQQAHTAWAAAPNSVSNVWYFARASFDWADLATNSTQRAAVANEAIHACRSALAHSPDSVPTLYYLGLNLGELSQTRGLSALKLVHEMETRWLAARTLDATFDHAGPDRCLGLLYLDAPGWPASVGSNAKARTHLEQAVATDAAYPENLLCLAEAEIRWKRPAAARKLMDQLDRIWTEAKATWAGPDFDATWADWQRRRTKANATLQAAAR